MTGKLIIFSAPSGSGKSTLINYLMGQDLNLAFSISATSRPPRGTERDGVEYFFLTPEEFRQRIANGEFLEYEEVYKDRFYGTLKAQVEKQLEAGQNVVFDVDVHGGCHIKEFYGDRALSMFIQPPSVEELRRRLESRGTDTPEVIDDRIARAEYELTFAPRFDTIVVNDDLEKAKAEPKPEWEVAEQVVRIPLEQLKPFKNHPFKVLDDEAMQRTVESVEQYGVLSPLIARPRPEGGYEIISGHRRQHAAQLAGLETLPVIVRNMDDDAAMEEVMLFGRDNGHYPTFDLFKFYYVIVDNYTREIQYISDEIYVTDKYALTVEDRNNDGISELYIDYFKDGKFTVDERGYNLRTTRCYDRIEWSPESEKFNPQQP